MNQQYNTDYSDIRHRLTELTKQCIEDPNFTIEHLCINQYRIIVNYGFNLSLFNRYSNDDFEVFAIYAYQGKEGNLSLYVKYKGA